MAVLQFRTPGNITGQGIESLYQAIRQALKYEHLETIAQETEISQMTLYRWLSGETVMPNAINIQNVAVALGFSLEWKR